jgi:hypothetical protein
MDQEYLPDTTRVSSRLRSRKNSRCIVAQSSVQIADIDLLAFEQALNGMRERVAFKLMKRCGKALDRGKLIVGEREHESSPRRHRTTQICVNIENMATAAIPGVEDPLGLPRQGRHSEAESPTEGPSRLRYPRHTCRLRRRITGLPLTPGGYLKNPEGRKLAAPGQSHVGERSCGGSTPHDRRLRAR